VPADQIYRPDTPDAARAAVREAAGRHADLVKLWVDDMMGTVPKMRPDLYTAIIDEAHRQHLRVAAHVYYLADAKALVAAGADILAHSIRDQPVDTALISAMKAHGTWYVPTLTVDASFVVYADHPVWLTDPLFRAGTDPGVAEWLESPAVADSARARPRFAEYARAFATAKANVKSLVDAGVRVGFGTDAGAFAWRVQGFAEHEELRMLVGAGLTPAQALATATQKNAELLGLGATIGTLEPGKRADLVVIDGDPLTDIAATERIVAIWRAGRRIEPLVPLH
jgi:imidazolonepropionase-like amidohydrolase